MRLRVGIHSTASQNVIWGGKSESNGAEAYESTRSDIIEHSKKWDITSIVLMNPLAQYKEAIVFVESIEEKLGYNFINIKSRNRMLVIHRFCLIFILRENFSVSFDNIAEMMLNHGRRGDRLMAIDHSTVMYAKNQFIDLLSINDKISKQILREMIAILEDLAIPTTTSIKQYLR